MRWKELFLVPDYRIKDITGASFAGFYYICFQKSTSTIEGYYYHRNSEQYTYFIHQLYILFWSYSLFSSFFVTLKISKS
jgi:hypothetical protein